MDRTDVGQGDIPAEKDGVHYFPYRPPHLAAHPTRRLLAAIVNDTAKILSSDRYDAVLWAQGSPRIEETLYWLNLLLDTDALICGVAAQRSQQQVSADGPHNILDAVTLIASRVWRSDHGANRLGAVLVSDQQIFAARDVQKGDARPGGYVTTGGHGGILGNISPRGPVLVFLPARCHTYLSQVNVSRLPATVTGLQRSGGALRSVPVAVKNARGELLGEAIPQVTIVKSGNYHADHYEDEPEREVDIHARLDQNLSDSPLAGFVTEGLSPYGTPTANAAHTALVRAVYSGM